MKLVLKQEHRANLENFLGDILQEIGDIDQEDRTAIERRLYDNLKPMFYPGEPEKNGRLANRKGREGRLIGC